MFKGINLKRVKGEVRGERYTRSSGSSRGGSGNELGTLARLTLQRAQSQWHELDEHLAWCDERIAAHAKGNDAVKAAATLLGIGPVTASAAVTAVGDFKQFKNGRPVRRLDWVDAEAAFERRQEQPGRHHQTRRHLLRTLLIQGAKSAVMTAHRR